MVQWKCVNTIELLSRPKRFIILTSKGFLERPIKKKRGKKYYAKKRKVHGKNSARSRR